MELDCVGDECDNGVMCFGCIIHYQFKREFYHSLKMKHVGEMTEEEFNEYVEVYEEGELHQYIAAIHREDKSRVDELICMYGIIKAIQLLIDIRGGIEVAPPNKQLLLYIIIRHHLGFSFHEFSTFLG
jgi:hypothetical protein